MAEQSNSKHINSPIFDFSLEGTDGKLYSKEDFSDKDLLVIIFMCNHCPYVKAVTKRFISFQEKYRDRKVQLIAINSNDEDAYPEDSFDNMKKYSAEYGLNFPYLHDRTQETARRYDAVCTPDIYVYDKERKLKYRGRLDDSWKDERLIKSKDLERATEQLLSGGEPEEVQIPSIGCSIKWKK